MQTVCSKMEPGSGEGDSKGGGRCKGCVIRTPYATLVAFTMCWVGSGVFCGTMYR